MMHLKVVKEDLVVAKEEAIAAVAAATEEVLAVVKEEAIVAAAAATEEVLVEAEDVKAVALVADSEIFLVNLVKAVTLAEVEEEKEAVQDQEKEDADLNIQNI